MNQIVELEVENSKLRELAQEVIDAWADEAIPLGEWTNLMKDAIRLLNNALQGFKS